MYGAQHHHRRLDDVELYLTRDQYDIAFREDVATRREKVGFVFIPLC
jgi:hypothetical protein